MAFSHVLKELIYMEEHKTYSDEAIRSTTEFYSKLHSTTKERLEQQKGNFPEYVEKVEQGILERCRLNSELDILKEMYEHGAITDKVLKAEEEEIEKSIRKMKVRPVDKLQFTPADLISRINFFEELGEDDISNLTRKLYALSFLPGEDIVKEGDHGDSLFVIGRGEVDIVTKGDDDKEIFLASLKAGQFFGEVALLHPQPRTATVRASTPATLLELSKDSLTPILDSAPHLKETLEEAYKKRVLNTQLSHIHAFEGLENEERDAIANGMKYESVEAGATVSDSIDRLYLIKEGDADVMSKGKKTITLHRGSRIGEDTLFKKTATGEKLVAKTELEIYSLDVETFEKIMKEIPSIADTLK